MSNSNNKRKHREIIEKLRLEEYKRNHPEECFCENPMYDINKEPDAYDCWDHPVYGNIKQPIYLCGKCGKNIIIRIAMA